MARRKNTAECYEIFLRISEKQAEAHQRQEARARARAPGGPEDGRTPPPPAETGRARAHGPGSRPERAPPGADRIAPATPATRRGVLDWSAAGGTRSLPRGARYRVSAWPASGSAESGIGPRELGPPLARRRLSRCVEHPGAELVRAGRVPLEVSGRVASRPRVPETGSRLDVPERTSYRTDGPAAIELLEAREPLPRGRDGDPDDLDSGGRDGDRTPLHDRGELAAGSDVDPLDPAAPIGRSAEAGARGGGPWAEEPEDFPAEDPGGGGAPRVATRRGAGALGACRTLLRGLFADRGDGVLGRTVQVRVSTLVLGALSLSTFLGLVGLYFRGQTRPLSPLHDQLFDEAERLALLDPARGSERPLDPAGVHSASADVGDGAPPAPQGPPGAAGGPAASGPAGEANPTGGTPAPPAASGAAILPSDKDAHWVRVRGEMGKEECVRLVEHLALLRRELAASRGCSEDSVACKVIDTKRRGIGDGERFTVYIGPFGSRPLAEAAAGELQRLTSDRDGGWSFNGNPRYFDGSYAVVRTRG